MPTGPIQPRPTLPPIPPGPPLFGAEGSPNFLGGEGGF